MAKGGWSHKSRLPSLPEVHASIAVPRSGGFWRKLLAFSGPGLLVSVGYMDPGNWATDLAGGAQFGYALLSVILISNLMAMLLQYLALKLGIVSGRDLAQACRDSYGRPAVLVLYVLCELAIIATDLAEVIGSAVALNLLFHVPLVLGVIITALDVILVLFLQQRGFRWVEIIVVAMVSTIGVSFIYELLVSRPDLPALAKGLVPTTEIISNPMMLYLAIGILGATVMPHNLYLHSSVVQTRAYDRDDVGRALAIRFAAIDSTVALFLAFFINGAILVLSAAAFHGTQYSGIADIADAYKLLAPVLGAPLASAVFAIALLASGQSSTMTGTLAGQIVMEGFLELRLRPWVRRLITRLLAVVPAAIVVGVYGPRMVGPLLILSQVVLSLQLSFAVFPLVMFTGDPAKMGRFVNGPLLKAGAWAVALLIGVLNAWLLVQTVMGWFVPGE